jgi:hypothetical protein
MNHKHVKSSQRPFQGDTLIFTQPPPLFQRLRPMYVIEDCEPVEPEGIMLEEVGPFLLVTCTPARKSILNREFGSTVTQ